MQSLTSEKNRRQNTMCEMMQSLPGNVIVFNNFQALEEAIAEITETENISNEKEFFDSYQIRILKLD
jgi:uncharacterized membrane protein